MSDAPNSAEVGARLRTMRIDKCPFCGSRLLFVEGVTHYVREAELDENGQLHAVTFASLEQVPYHRTTWVECDENCAESNECSFELALFDDDFNDEAE
jgi:hypothetical protein